MIDLFCRTLMALLAGSILMHPVASAQTQSAFQFKSVDPDASSLEGTLYIPAGEGPFPLVIHGHTAGGLARSDTLLAEYLQKQGAAVLIFNGYPPGRRDTSVGARVPDVLGAVRAARSHPRLDSSRMATTGASAGGSASYGAARSYARRPVDPAKLFKAQVLLYPGLTSGICAGMESTADEPMKVPTLLITGNQDRFGSPRPCEELAKTIQGQGGSFEVRIYDGATHWFDNPNADVGPSGRDRYNGELAERMRREVTAFLKQKLGF